MRKLLLIPVAILGVVGHVLAQPTIALQGPMAPTQLACPSGTGMGANTVVDVFFDPAQVAKTASTATGTWRVCFHVPANAAPGEHSVTAVDSLNNAATNGLFVSAPWGEHHFASRKKSASPTENQLNTSNLSGLELDRSLEGHAPGSITGITAIDGNVAFTSTDGFGGADAFRGGTRQFAWFLQNSGPPQPIPPYVSYADDGTTLSRSIFFANNNGQVNRVDISDNDIESGFTHRWTQPAGTANFSGAPTAALCTFMTTFSQGVLLPSSDGHLYCLDQGIGSQTWVLALGGRVGSPTCPDNSNIYVANSLGTLFHINSFGATKLYSVAASAGMDAPVYTGNFLLVTRTDGKVEALVPSTGALVWTTASPVTPFVGSAAALNNFAYAVTTNGTVYAINLSDGSFAWSHALGGVAKLSPAVTRGLVYVAIGARLWILNAATGAILWTHPTGSTVTAGPVVSDGSIFFGTTADNLDQYDLHPVSGPIQLKRSFGVPSKSIELQDLRRDPNMPITPFGEIAPMPNLDN